MKRLHVQLQPARSPELDVNRVVAQLQTVAPAGVTTGQDSVPYINVDFVTANVGALWSALRGVIRADTATARCVIACCEGEHGWDDYLLLHHFDPTQPLDDVL